MSNMRLITIAASLLIFFCSSATAEITAKKMLEFSGSPVPLNETFCGAYMAGFADAISLAQATATTKNTSEVDWFAITEQFPCGK